MSKRKLGNDAGAGGDDHVPERELILRRLAALERELEEHRAWLRSEPLLQRDRKPKAA